MFRQKKTVVSVHGFVVNRKGEFLVVRRAMNDSLPGIWEMPGGKVEFGEDPKAAVVREVREETGLDIIPIRPLNTGSSVKDNKHSTRIAFMAIKSWLDQGVTLSREHTSYKWIINPFDVSNTSDFLIATYDCFLKWVDESSPSEGVAQK